MSITDNTQGILDESARRIRQKLGQSAVIVERRAKQVCPVRTGALRRSITHEFETDKSVVIGSNMEYAPAVELGTRPHTIVPNKAAALWWPGAKHPVKIVHHPGTPAKPYLRPALEASRGDIERIFAEK